MVSQSLSDINQTITQLQLPAAEGEVRLKLTPSFAFKWLVPRLQDFYQQYPEIKIQTFAEGALVDHQDTSFDLVIDYCRQPPNNGILLLNEDLLPVMSLATGTSSTGRAKHVGKQRYYCMMQCRGGMLVRTTNGITGSLQ